ncbi:hypothetical protein WJX77_005434 [Trebouxia sp. C0004]
MLVAFSRRVCHSRLLSLRSLVTETASSAPAEEPSTSTPNAAVQESAGQQEGRRPAWWSDPKVGAIYAYNIINKRFKDHGPQREENYRQLIRRVQNPREAALALKILVEGRKARAVLEQHDPFTFYTSQLLITTCLSTKSYDVALEALQRAHELGLQFDNNEAYYKLMKIAITNGRLDIATSVFEAMKDNGVRPRGKVVHILIMGSIVNGRRDLAEAYAEEFRCNNVKINQASQKWLDGTKQPDNVSKLKAETSEGFQDSTINEAPAEQQRAATAVASA